MKGERFELTFFRKGFFGYGEEGDFRPWGLSHFAALAITVSVIVLLALFGPAFRNLKGETHIRCALAMTMMLCEFSFFWRLAYIGPESHERKTMMMRLPLQVCEWTLLLTIPMLFLRSQFLFDMTFYLSMTCGLLPLVVPAVISTTGPRYFRFYQFWGEHVLPIWSVYYMIFVWGFRPRPIGILAEYLFLLLLVPPSLWLNRRFEDCYYLYLKPEKFPMLRALTDKVSMGRMLLLFGGVLTAMCFVVQCILQLILYFTK